MGYIKNGFFLVVCFLVGVGIAKVYLNWASSHRGMEQVRPVVQTGIGDCPAYRGFSLDGAKLPSEAELTKLCVAWRGEFATAVGLNDAASLTPQALGMAVGTIHGQGLKVVLLPPLVVVAAGGGVMNPYGRPLGEVAAEAQAAGVDGLCISWLNAEPDVGYWREAIAGVRAAYKGPVILAGMPEVLLRLTFAEDADVLGAVGPMELPQRLPHASDKFALADVRVAWSCDLSSLESLARVHKRKLALLNMAVPATISLKMPLMENDPPVANRELQALTYEALLVETKGRAETTAYLLIPWDQSAGSARELAGLTAKAKELWDPANKKKEFLGLPPAFEEQDAGGDEGGTVKDGDGGGGG